MGLPTKTPTQRGFSEDKNSLTGSTAAAPKIQTHHLLLICTH